ncbi:MAG: hypothetical protein HKN91_13090 [Acidimicrobiia bacterium]|nr:hypothetical protein [Acidimicrobiia bacterium]
MRSILLCLAVATAAASCGDPKGPIVTGDGTITVDLATRHQQIVGWEATAQAGQTELETFPAFQSEVLDRTANQLGINRVRLEIRSGAENDQDYFALWRSGSISRDAFRETWYAPVNDNADPNSINSGGFHFTELDDDVNTIVEPLRQRLQARGERLYVNLCFVDFHSEAGITATDPDEYAELMVATFQHLQSQYGWVPDAVEIILEPDNSSWNGTRIGESLVATNARLAAAGFNPDFIAPSTTNMTNAIEYFDDLAAVPGAVDALTELSYHRYSGVSTSSLQTIASRAATHGLNTSMLEHIGSGYESLHQDLKVGMASAWSQFTIAWDDQIDDGGKYYVVNVSNPTEPEVRMALQTRMLRQYMFYVRAGAQRVGATSGDSQLDPLAFVNPDGKLVVVVKAAVGRQFDVGGIPVGSYGINYTTFSEFDVELPEFNLVAGESMSVTMPETGVVTIYQK